MWIVIASTKKKIFYCNLQILKQNIKQLNKVVSYKHQKINEYITYINGKRFDHFQNLLIIYFQYNILFFTQTFVRRKKNQQTTIQIQHNSAWTML